MHQRAQFNLDPGRTALRLAWIALGLLAVHMLISYLWAHDGPRYVRYRYVEMFDLDEEKGFGTWFAAVILLFAGRLLLVISRDSRNGGDGLWGWWLVLAVGFHFLSVDEVAGMHEFLNSYGDDLLGIETKWTTYAMVATAMVFAAFIPFLVFMLKKGHKRTVILCLLAAFLYVGGAVGIEKMSPPYDDMTRSQRDDVLDSTVYNLGWISVEESMEMAGAILFIYTLLDYLRGGRSNQLRASVYSQSVHAVSSRDSGPPPG